MGVLGTTKSERLSIVSLVRESLTIDCDRRRRGNVLLDTGSTPVWSINIRRGIYLLYSVCLLFFWRG